MTLRAISLRSPIMDPLPSSRMTTSFEDAAAWTYLRMRREAHIDRSRAEASLMNPVLLQKNCQEMNGSTTRLFLKREFMPSDHLMAFSTDA
ncbi:unnamed protein product, partial [Ixodes pacificus]